MEESSLIVESAVASNQRVLSDGSPKSLHSQHVSDNFLVLLLELGVDEGHVIITGDAVAEGTHSVVQLSDPNILGQRVPQLLELLVGDGAGHQKTVLVAYAESSHQGSACNGALHHWDVLTQVGVEEREGAVRCTLSYDAVGVG